MSRYSQPQNSPPQAWVNANSKLSIRGVLSTCSWVLFHPPALQRKYKASPSFVPKHYVSLLGCRLASEKAPTVPCEEGPAPILPALQGFQKGKKGHLLKIIHRQPRPATYRHSPPIRPIMGKPPHRCPQLQQLVLVPALDRPRWSLMSGPFRGRMWVASSHTITGPLSLAGSGFSWFALGLI